MAHSPLEVVDKLQFFLHLYLLFYYRGSNADCQCTKKFASALWLGLGLV